MANFPKTWCAVDKSDESGDSKSSAQKCSAANINLHWCLWRKGVVNEASWAEEGVPGGRSCQIGASHGRRPLTWSVHARSKSCYFVR